MISLWARLIRDVHHRRHGGLMAGDELYEKGIPAAVDGFRNASAVLAELGLE
jgi:hypothetical protein